MPPTVRHYASEVLIRSAIFPVVEGLWRTRLHPDSLRLPPGPCFLYGNHSNNLDPFLVNWFEPFGYVSSGVLTAEYMKGGPVSAALRGIGLLATRKRVPEPHLIGRIMRLIAAGRKIMIYPEGGRRWDGRPEPWIPSTAKLFARVGIPVYPVQTIGSYVAWPRWARFARPARPLVKVLDPVPLDRSMSAEEAERALFPLVDIDENEPPQEVRPAWAFRPADGIERLLYRHPVTGEFDALFTPDGEQILDREGLVRWRMRPDSLIEDRLSGTVLRTDDLYRSMCAMPLEEDSDGCVTRRRVRLSTGEDEKSLNAGGEPMASLTRSHVQVGDHLAIPLEDIQYIGIERNFKLQLWTSTGLVQLAFVYGGSARGWENSIRTLRGEG